MKPSEMMIGKISSKGWVVIPALVRRRHGLKPGTAVEFREQGDRIVIIPRSSDEVETLYGKYSGEVSLTRALLDEREKELRREENKLCNR